MASTAANTVTIGEHSFTVQRFRGLKAIMAMAAVTRIGREIPDIMADVVKEYQKRNTVTITEPMARLPRWESFKKEDFDAAEKTTGKREIELPQPMTANEQIMYALPTLLERARKEVTRLLALLIIPNDELKAADKNDTVEEKLDEYEDLLLYEAELDELVDLALKASEVLQDQLAERKDRLGNLMRSVWKTLRLRTPSQTQVTTPDALPTSTQQTSSEDVQISSTDSDELTDGVESELSTMSRG